MPLDNQDKRAQIEEDIEYEATQDNTESSSDPDGPTWEYEPLEEE